MNTNVFFSVAAGLLLMMGTSLAAAQTAAPDPGRPAGRRAPAATDAAFTALDTSKDGMLSRQEFQAGYPGLTRVVALEFRLRDQFQTLDADKSGAVEAGEYANLELVKRAGKSAPALSGFDANRNQKLEFAEYVAAVRQLSARTASEKK